MNDEAKRWLVYAETDIGVAKHLYDSYVPKPCEIICYHCQQAAEKAIKAVILALGIPGGLPQKHDLSFLLGQMSKMLDIPETCYEYADHLTPYGVSARYPNELYLDDSKAKFALEYAEYILSWANSVAFNDLEK